MELNHGCLSHSPSAYFLLESGEALQNQISRFSVWSKLLRVPIGDSKVSRFLGFTRTECNNSCRSQSQGRLNNLPQIRHCFLPEALPCVVFKCFSKPLRVLQEFVHEEQRAVPEEGSGHPTKVKHESGNHRKVACWLTYEYLACLGCGRTQHHYFRVRNERSSLSRADVVRGQSDD